MTASLKRLVQLPRFGRVAPRSPVKAGRCGVGVALCTLTLLAAMPDNARAQGSLVSWGYDAYGQVSDTPAGAFSAVAAGAYQSVAIRTDGTLVVWGSNFYGENVSPAGTYSAVAAGSLHNVAIRTDGTLFSWGSDSYGEVSGTPMTGTYVAVTAGAAHNLAINTAGTLVAWGSNFWGERDAPAGSYIAVAAGHSYSVAIDMDGALVSWGNDDFGQVSGTPAGAYTAVAAGYHHGVAIDTDGALVSWGDDFYGNVSATPTTGTYTAVAAGPYRSMALRTDGTLVSWGDDSNGTVSGTPAGVFSAIAVGFGHSVAITRPLPLTPADLIVDLILQVASLNLQHGIENSLDAKLDKAFDALEAENATSAVSKLNAFINEVNAQRGKKIPTGDADALIAAALEIIDLLQ